MSLLSGQIAVFLGLLSLFICILSLLVIGIAAPLGLIKIDLMEEMQDFSTSINKTAMSLVALLGRALRRLWSLITFALLASFRFFVSKPARIVHHVRRSAKETTRLVITDSRWPVKSINAGVRILLSHRFSSVPKPSPTAHLEQEIKWLRRQTISSAEWVRKLSETMHMHKDAAYAAKIEARQAKKAKERQDALVAHQQKTIETLRKYIAWIPKEHLQLREKNVALEQEVDVLEGKLGNALAARNRAVEEADLMVTNAQDLQHLAEEKKDRAKSNLEAAKTDCEERLKVSASEISNLKNEIATKSSVDPTIYSQMAQQVRTLHSERDDARDALESVTAQFEEVKAMKAAAQSLLDDTRAELQRVETQTRSELHNARVERTKSKAEAQREVAAARRNSDRYWRKSVADRKELTKARILVEDMERGHRMEIFDLKLEHDGNMQTAQSKINHLEACAEDLRAHIDSLNKKLVRAQKQARLPRDPELQNRLTLATAELQRVHNEHTTELQVVRKEHNIVLQRLKNEYATELQNRERELYRKCEEAFDEHKAKWRVGEEKLSQQVDHWKSRAGLADENVKALNHAAERAVCEQEQREKDFTTALQRREDEVVKRCEEAYEARLREHKDTQQQLQGRLDERDSDLLRTKEELEDLRASVSQGIQQVMAEDPAASAQISQTLPASEHEPKMTEEAFDEETFNEWFATVTPPTLEAMTEYFDQQLAADSAVPLQTSPNSPPLEPALELQEPESDPTSVLDPHLAPISPPAQASVPLATLQYTQAPPVRPILTPASRSKAMVPRGPRKPKSKPNHYTQQRREEEAAYNAGLGPKLNFMFFDGPEPSRGAPSAPQSVPSGIPGSSGFGKIP